MVKREEYPEHVHHHLNSHRKHRNVLYGLVILLALIQITSFVIFTVQISNLSVKIDQESQRTTRELKDYTTRLVDAYDSLYQENFKEITNILATQEQTLAEQQASFDEQIEEIKSTQADFSEVIEDSVKGSVTVSTEGSLGSGFIVSEDGYVVTNFHVIAGQEDDVTVRTFDRKTLQATFVGKDELRDLALLKVGGSFDYLEIANSDNLQPGNKVIAIGNPLGLSFTATEGIVSAVHREGPNGLDEYIQTDVSLNPGNSGGPLIDTKGRVVGINNFKIGGAESLGFSLESNAMRGSVNAIANETIIP